MAVTLSEQASKAFKDGLIAGVRRIFRAEPGNTIGGQSVSDFLAGPLPNNPLGAFQHRSGRAVCDRWARGERASILPGRDAYYRQLCEPYLGAAMPGDPSTETPFTGGQCVGLGYLVTYQYNTVSTAGLTIEPPIVITNDASIAGGIPGPIRGIESRPRPGGTDMIILYGAGQETIIRQSGAAQGDFRFPKILSVTPFGGGPDNCGDPPDEFDSGDPNPDPDPNPGPVGGPVGFPFPDLDITIGPGGDIQIDFGDGEPPEVVDPTQPDGDGDSDGGGPGGGSGAPTNPGAPGDTGATGDGGSEEGEAGEGEELTGVLVRVISAHENANKVDRSPVTVFRGVGYVAMGYPGLLGVDTSAAVVESPQFFHAQQRGLTAWRVRANVGFNLETTPYYRETES